MLKQNNNYWNQFWIIFWHLIENYFVLCFSIVAGWVQKDSSATDYSGISELAEEEEEKYYKHAVSIFSRKKNTSTAGKLCWSIIVEFSLKHQWNISRLRNEKRKIDHPILLVNVTMHC